MRKMERIASRLGDQNLQIHTHDPELQDRKEWQDSLIRKNIVEITGYEFLEPGQEQDPDDPKPVFELPQIGLTNLIPNTSSIYYYHPNHLGSTCYVTDGNASVVQGFLYAPFGEITNEHNVGWQSGTLPKYSFNAKELDEETWMYYYEARYMAPPTFISRDPLFEKYPTFTPYAYCANNPVKYVDPDGREIWIKAENGSMVEYKYGMNSYGHDKFSVKVINALNEIYNTNTGKELLEDLVESTNTFYIEKSEKSGFERSNAKKAYKQQLLTDPTYSKTFEKCTDKSILDGGSGGTVKWNSSGSILPTTKGGMINAVTDLAHELFHAKDANHGLLDDRIEKGITRSDWQAVYGENMLRNEMNVPLRTHYQVKVDKNYQYIGGTGTKMIENGKPIKPWWL